MGERVLESRNTRYQPRFGSHITELRRRTGRSQAVFGPLAGLSESALNKIERGERVPKPGTIVSMCDALGIPESDPRRDQLLLEAAHTPITEWKQTATLPTVSLRKATDPVPAPPRRLDYAVANLIRTSGFTYVVIANRCNLSPSEVDKLSRGAKTPTPVTLAKVCYGLDRRKNLDPLLLSLAHKQIADTRTPQKNGAK
jgi:transcriptional regulator with XRE-family HTH domain